MGMNPDRTQMVPLPEAFLDLFGKAQNDLDRKALAADAGIDPDGPIFKVGEIVELRGARFRVEAIGRELLALRPAGRAT